MMHESNLSTQALISQYQKSGDAALREQIVTKHLYIADIIARRFSGRGVDYDDLYQVASLALLKAIERFDASKGVKFTTYITPSMLGEVKNYFRDKSHVISLPRRGAELNQRMRKVRLELEQTLMRSPTPDELAQAMEVPVEWVIETLEMQGALMPASLDSAPMGVDDSTLGVFLGRDDAGYERFEMQNQMASMLERLTEQERGVIERKYFDNMSQREIGEAMGISQMTVSRLERRALEAMRSLLDNT